jgi:ubiquinone/menaquinone biosynthesis C-methylase UbiE
MAVLTETKSGDVEFGFSVSEGADWSEYLAFRPLYPQSFFNHIFKYHSQKSQAAYNTAHDVGAGCGIVSSTLASQFQNVIVSDPNDGYTTLARKLLVKDSGISETRITFLQEGAEKSSVASRTVDLIAACEMMQWTDTAVAVREFGRELTVGGTLALTYYTRPRIVGHDGAQKIWKAIWDEYSKRAQGELYDRAFEIVNSGYQCIGFPDAEWEKIKRVYINCGGSTEHFKIDGRLGRNAVRADEETVWVEGDDGWADVQGVDWLKGYLATWVPKIPESEIQHLWDELESTLNGEKTRIESPVVVVLATKKA